MILLPTIIASETAARIYSAQQAQKGVGPTAVVASKSPEQIKADARESRVVETVFWVALLLPGVLFAGVGGLFLFAALKIIFAVHGESFP